MICKYCKLEFKPAHKIQKFCSRACCKLYHSRTDRKRNTDKAIYERDKEKRIAITSKWKKENRLRASISKYGLTVEMYNSMLESQGGSCAICGTKNPADKRSKFFRVDHDHKTGKVRGLLCGSCNTGLGMFKDNIESMYKAANYLEGFRHQDDIG